MPDIRLTSEKTDHKPETIVILETNGLRELQPSELVHLRESPGDSHCWKCQKRALVWTDEARIWERSSARCEAV